MATDAEIRAIAWREARNWQTLTKDTNKALAPRLARLRSTLQGNAASWWANAGATLNALTRWARINRIALDRFRELSPGEAPAYWSEAVRIAPAADQTAIWSWILDPRQPKQASRGKQLAEFEVFARALTTSQQTMRRGIEGKSYQTAAEHAAQEARSRPADVLVPTGGEWPDIPWMKIIITLAAVVAIREGFKKW